MRCFLSYVYYCNIIFENFIFEKMTNPNATTVPKKFYIENVEKYFCTTYIMQLQLLILLLYIESVEEKFKNSKTEEPS